MPSPWEHQPWIETNKLLNWIREHRHQHERENERGVNIMKRLQELRENSQQPTQPEKIKGRFL